MLARINDRLGQSQISRELGVTLGEWRVLAVMQYLGEASLRSIAKQAFLDEGQVSRSVASLAARGFVDRLGSKGGRGLKLRLSPTGGELHGHGLAFAQQLNQPSEYGLTDGEYAALMGLLDRVLHRVHSEYAALRASVSGHERGEAVRVLDKSMSPKVARKRP